MRRYGPRGPIRPCGSAIRGGSPVCLELALGSSAWAAVYTSLRRPPAASRPATSAASGRGQAGEDVLQQALARGEPRFRELADDLHRRGHELGAARRLDRAASAVGVGLEPLLGDRGAAAPCCGGSP